MKKVNRKTTKHKKKVAASGHKRQPVASHHRHVHKSVAWVVIAVWLAVIACSAGLSYSYFEHHRALHIKQNGIDLSVNSVNYDDLGKIPFKTPVGWKFVVVDVTIKNNSAYVFNFAPVLQTYMTDSTGSLYAMAPSDLTDPIAGGPIPVHVQKTGTLSYLVPINAKGVAFHFTF